MGLYVDDEYVAEMGEYIRGELENLNQNVREYLRILKGVCEDGISEGETKNALEEFISQAEGLKGIDEKGTAAFHYCGAYVEQIDDADKDLY